MKYYFLAVGCLLGTSVAFGQIKDSVSSKADTLQHVSKGDTIEVGSKDKRNKLTIIFEEGKRAVDQDVNKDKGYEEEEDDDLGFYGGITFARFDLGVAKMLDGGSLTLSKPNKFMDYKSWKSVNVGFDVLKLGYKVSDNFKIYASAGLDWTHFRLKRDVIILEDTAPLDYTESPIDYRKNRFSSSYIRLPVSFEYNSGSKGKDNKFKVSAGPIFGILIHGSQKLISTDDGKEKSTDDYNYAPFRYGGFARIGYKGFGVFVKYYANDMFVNSPDQEDLKNISFGVTFFL